MNHLKQFLYDLTESGVYYAEVVDNIAEIYIVGDVVPAAFLELDEVYYIVNIRCDISPRVVATLVRDMTTIDEDLQFGPDFIISQENGILYGQDATATFFATVFNAMEEIQLKQESQLNNATYIVQEPIYGWGNKHDKRPNKMQRLWGDDWE